MKNDPVRMVFSNNSFSNERDMYGTKKFKIQGITIALIARGLGIRSGNFLLRLWYKKHVLAGVAQWIECQPANHRVAGSIPS